MESLRILLLPSSNNSHCSWLSNIHTLDLKSRRSHIRSLCCILCFPLKVRRKYLESTPPVYVASPWSKCKETPGENRKKTLDHSIQVFFLVVVVMGQEKSSPWCTWETCSLSSSPPSLTKLVLLHPNLCSLSMRCEWSQLACPHHLVQGCPCFQVDTGCCSQLSFQAGEGSYQQPSFQDV